MDNTLIFSISQLRNNGKILRFTIEFLIQYNLIIYYILYIPKM